MSGENDSPTIRRGDRVTPAEYRSLLAAIKWRPLEQEDVEVAAGLDASWNVTARMSDGRLVGLAPGAGRRRPVCQCLGRHRAPGTSAGWDRSGLFSRQCSSKRQGGVWFPWYRPRLGKPSIDLPDLPKLMVEARPSSVAPLSQNCRPATDPGSRGRHRRPVHSMPRCRLRLCFIADRPGRAPRR